MNKILRATLYVVLLFGPALQLLAQQPGFVSSVPEIKPPEEIERNILTDLTAIKAGQGVVRIIQSSAIKDLIKFRDSTGFNIFDDESLYTTMQGYKVQVYSSNAANSNHIAKTRSTQVKQLYPNLESIILYNAPFWKVQVGNFVTREEAMEVLRNIKKTFPAFGKQSFIVRTTIKVPL